ncbi:MAG: type II toxin-antitoxin system Phd/YefM family antitoxin [Deltaproteobacteria bacterium]|nr:type II toxin-antitoxin system Phd/YefM family antitoxin [Deltaproteobacteria bacterium]
MQASIVELRYHMKDVLKALERNETVQVLYRGKVKATLVPEQPLKKMGHVSEHPFFGMDSEEYSVEDTLEQLRGGRFNAI